MTITDKTQETVEAIKDFFETHAYHAPVINWSGGKDSTVLLHLITTRFTAEMSILFYEDPWFPEKTFFQHNLAAKIHMWIYNYPPLRVSLKTSDQMVALVSEYSTGPHSVEAVLKNTIEYEDGQEEPYLCGVNFLTRPCGSFSYPWDLVIVGHKNCDTDPIFGPIPLHSEHVMRDEGPDFYFPLREWTDNDIWDYIEENNVPVQLDRYDVKNRREWEDKTYNSDWYPVCVRCVDKRREGETVYCPRFDRPIKNISSMIPEWGWVPDYFGGKKNG